MVSAAVITAEPARSATSMFDIELPVPLASNVLLVNVSTELAVDNPTRLSSTYFLLATSLSALGVAVDRPVMVLPPMAMFLLMVNPLASVNCATVPPSSVTVTDPVALSATVTLELPSLMVPPTDVRNPCPSTYDLIDCCVASAVSLFDENVSSSSIDVTVDPVGSVRLDMLTVPVPAVVMLMSSFDLNPVMLF